MNGWLHSHLMRTNKENLPKCFRQLMPPSWHRDNQLSLAFHLCSDFSAPKVRSSSDTNRWQVLPYIKYESQVRLQVDGSSSLIISKEGHTLWCLQNSNELSCNVYLRWSIFSGLILYSSVFRCRKVNRSFQIKEDTPHDWLPTGRSRTQSCCRFVVFHQLQL